MTTMTTMKTMKLKGSIPLKLKGSIPLGGHKYPQVSRVNFNKTGYFNPLKLYGNKIHLVKAEKQDQGGNLYAPGSYGGWASDSTIDDNNSCLDQTGYISSFKLYGKILPKTKKGGTIRATKNTEEGDDGKELPAFLKKLVATLERYKPVLIIMDYVALALLILGILKFTFNYIVRPSYDFSKAVLKKYLDGEEGRAAVRGRRSRRAAVRTVGLPAMGLPAMGLPATVGLPATKREEATVGLPAMGLPATKREAEYGGFILKGV